MIEFEAPTKSNLFQLQPMAGGGGNGKKPPKTPPLTFARPPASNGSNSSGSNGKAQPAMAAAPAAMPATAPAQPAQPVMAPKIAAVMPQPSQRMRVPLSKRIQLCEKRYAWKRQRAERLAFAAELEKRRRAALRASWAAEDAKQPAQRVRRTFWAWAEGKGVHVQHTAPELD